MTSYFRSAADRIDVFILGNVRVAIARSRSFKGLVLPVVTHYTFLLLDSEMWLEWAYSRLRNALRKWLIEHGLCSKRTIDSLYIFTGNSVTSYIRLVANPINVLILGHVWIAISQ